MKRFIALVAAALVFNTVPVNALEVANPGKSLGGIALGSSRATAVAIAQKRLVGSKGHSSHTYAKGLVEDEWDMKQGTESSSFEILSSHGHVIQLRAWSSAESGQTNLSFAQLMRRHRLRKRVYLFQAPQDSGYNGFYYDDVKRGVCFTAGANDDFILTAHPDAIIIHRPGVPSVAVENGLRGKPVTGRNARAYASVAEARRAQEHEINHHNGRR